MPVIEEVVYIEIDILDCKRLLIGTTGGHKGANTITLPKYLTTTPPIPAISGTSQLFGRKGIPHR